MNAAPQNNAIAQAIEIRIQEAVSLDPFPDPTRNLVSDISRHLCLAEGARRFRPQLVETLGELVDLNAPAIQAIGVAAEIIHAASLLHDDVVDESSARRGRPTANTVWGNAAAVLAGDWLLGRAFAQLDTLPVEITRSAIAMVGEMSASALIEVGSRGRVLPFEQWQTMAEGKTGALFAWCGSAVAKAANRPEAANPLDQFGRRLGLVFQLADDLRDFLDANSGKPLYADLRNGNPSAVLSLASRKDPEIASKLEEKWKEGGDFDVEPLVEAVQKSGALAGSLKLLESQTQAALDFVRSLDPKNRLSSLFDSLRPQAEF